MERKAFTAKVARPEPVCEMIARGLVANYHDSYENLLVATERFEVD